MLNPIFLMDKTRCQWCSNELRHLSMHTLFRSVTGGVDWGDMANLLIYINWIWGYMVKHSFHRLCFVFVRLFAI